MKLEFTKKNKISSKPDTILKFNSNEEALENYSKKLERCGNLVNGQ